MPILRRKLVFLSCLLVLGRQRPGTAHAQPQDAKLKHFTVHDGLPFGSVRALPQEVGRVLLNLLSNAFDAVSGVEALRVVASTRRVEESVEVRVEDNGPGIAAEARDKIFEPFYTTKPAGSGTGLVLSLSYDIVTQGHSGMLTVESAPGQGAAFVVRLPSPERAAVSGRAVERTG